MEFFIKNKYLLGLGAIIIALVLYKLPHLSLPYYWDEAWPYSAAVHTMYNHGLSLSPASIPSFVSRGHPVMFHFLAALWMNIFGTGLVAGHCFALFISILTLVSVYIFGKKFFSERVGFIAALLLGAQAVFIAQSAFLMPEMLMALWAMISLYAYFSNKRALFIITTAAMLLTKESGGVLIITLGLSSLLQFIGSSEKKAAVLLKEWALIACPVLIAFIYFVAQKIIYGWFLYPFYTDYISSNWTAFKENLPSAFAYVFIYYGRNGLTLFVILSAIITRFIHKSKYTENEKRILPVFTCFIAVYFLFSSINYYIPRYLLYIFPPFVIAVAVLLDKAFSRMKLVYPLIIAGTCITCIYFYAKQRVGGDNDYAPFVKTDLATVRYCEQEKLNDKHIFAPSVLRIDFTEIYAAYLTGKPFEKIQSDFDNNTEYCIFSNEEEDIILSTRIKKENRLELVKRFEDGPAWCELYKVVR